MRLGADHEAPEHPEARDVFVTGHLLFPSILLSTSPPLLLQIREENNPGISMLMYTDSSLHLMYSKMLCFHLSEGTVS